MEPVSGLPDLYENLKYKFKGKAKKKKLQQNKKVYGDKLKVLSHYPE